MANRILIIDDAGVPIFGLDGHHGARHAAEWTDTVLAQLAAQGVLAFAVELHPAAGGDDVRRGVISQLARLRAELRTLPDGRRELIGLHRYPDATPGASRASVGIGNGLAKGQAAATPLAITGALRVVAAPPGIANPRAPIRIPRGRANVPPEQPRTTDQIRHARRAARAAARGTP